MSNQVVKWRKATLQGQHLPWWLDLWIKSLSVWRKKKVLHYHKDGRSKKRHANGEWKSSIMCMSNVTSFRCGKLRRKNADGQKRERNWMVTEKVSTFSFKSSVLGQTWGKKSEIRNERLVTNMAMERGTEHMCNAWAIEDWKRVISCKSFARFLSVIDTDLNLCDWITPVQTVGMLRHFGWSRNLGRSAAPSSDHH